MGNSSLFGCEKLNKSKIFIPSCHFIFDLSNISHRGNRFKKFQEQTFLYITEDGSSEHQAAILSWLLSKRSGWRLGAVAQFAISCFLGLATIAFASSSKIFVVAFLAVPVIGNSQIYLSNGVVLNLHFFPFYLHLSLQIFNNRDGCLHTWIPHKHIHTLGLNLIWNTCSYFDAQISEGPFGILKQSRSLFK